MTTLLRDVIAYGTATRALELKRKDLAGKTGTTNENVDAWFCGFNQSMVGIAWIGFDQPKTLGTNETGGVAALPIWISFMQKALKGVPEKMPEPPPGVVSVRINAETGLRDDSSNLSDWFFSEFTPRSREWRRSRPRPRSPRRARPRATPATSCSDLVFRYSLPGHRGNSAFRGRPYGRRPVRRATRRTACASRRRRRGSSPSTASPTGRWRSARPRRQLMLPEREALPDDGEIEAALVEHHALFGGEAHVAALRRQREEALSWMRRLAQFEPALVGGVAAGWATEHSDIRDRARRRRREDGRARADQRGRRLPRCRRRRAPRRRPSSTSTRRRAALRLVIRTRRRTAPAPAGATRRVSDDVACRSPRCEALLAG